MELPVSAQAWEFFLSAILGAALALAYDLLRGPRRLLPGWTWFLDLLFGLLVFCSLVWFLLVPGRGLFRLYCFLGLALGAALWFLTLGPWFLRIWIVCLRFLGAAFRLILRPVTKILKI